MSSVTHYGLSADGLARIVNSGGLNGRATPLVLSANAWTGEGPYSLTLPTMGVTSDTSACHVVIAPSPGSIAEYGNAGIYVSAQMEGSLIFSAESIPENDLIVNILIVTPNGYTSVVQNPEYGYLRYDEPQALTDEQKGNVITALGLGETGGITMELLWENASPNSEFAAQTVSVDLSGYQMIGLVFKWVSASDWSEQPMEILTKGDYQRLISATAETGSVSRRITKVSNTGITFAGGYANTGAHNACCVPTLIYGIKGVA